MANYTILIGIILIIVGIAVTLQAKRLDKKTAAHGLTVILGIVIIIGGLITMIA